MASGRLVFTDHASEKMEKRGISRGDVLACLRRGQVVSSDFDTEHQDWAYRVGFRQSLNEFLITVVAIPDDADDDIVVTVFFG